MIENQPFYMLVIPLHWCIIPHSSTPMDEQKFMFLDNWFV